MEPELAEQREIQRVALLTGGGDRPYALGLASSLMELSVPFDFIGSDDVNSPELHGQDGVRFLNLRGDQNPAASVARKCWRLIRYYARLFKYAAETDAQLFHILWNNKFEAFDRTALLFYYRLLGKKLVFTAHNVNARKRDGNDSWLNRATLRVLYRTVGHVFVHTEQMKLELMNEFGVPSSKISVIPFGLNSTVPNSSMDSAEARRRLGLGADEKVILFFGNIAPYKGLENLVDAMELLLRNRPNCRLVIAGRPKGSEAYWEAIQHRISGTPLGARVLARIGYVPDEETEVFFKAADVLVLPYKHVFQSGVLFLGYNFGLPAVATDVGSLREDIVPGQTGFVSASSEPSVLAGTLETFFASDLYLELGRRREEIRGFALERHSWSKVGAITRRVYGSLLKPGPSGGARGQD